MKKILFIVAHRLNRSPGQRFRFEQYLDFLSQSGFEYVISNILNENDDKTFYSKGKYFKKFLIFLKTILIRFKDIKRAKNFDIVFVYREAIMIGSTYFEEKLKQSGAKLIYDFDDAIWLPETSDGNKSLEWLKRPTKTFDIIKLSDMVIVGNRYLQNYSKKYNLNVHIMPTTINTNYHTKKPTSVNDKICIGWTGTNTTLKHFETILPVLKILKQKYEDKIYFKIIANFDTPKKYEVEVKHCDWNSKTEIEDLWEFDIGIMPLPMDEWSMGKCGLKGLQYMSLGIPAIMSAVGINNDIINEGENGYLANNNEEWGTKLSLLIDDKELRHKIGENGYQTIIGKYSVEANKNKYLELFNSLVYA